MEINIFSSGDKVRTVAIRRHLCTLLIAVLINMTFWFFQSGNEPIYEGTTDLASTVIDIIATCIETIVLMEASFAVSRLVIRTFWNVTYSFASLLIQNIVLLGSVVMISAAISYAYALMYPDSILLSWDVFICDVLVAYFLTSVFFTSYLTNRYREEKALAQQVTIDKLKLKTDNHFVFNSLATLGNLIQTNPEAAVEFNTSMSRMYRYIVSKGDSNVVSIQEELAFIEEYRKNMRVRYENIRLTLDENLQGLCCFIPPLTLQGLVENAIKHNRHGSKDRLSILVSYDKNSDSIVVTNNRLPVTRVLDSPGSGLDTLDQRYRFICGKNINVSECESSFMVKLPVIKQSDLP